MKIAISGAHSQGKTSILNYLQDHGVLADYKFMTSLTRGLQESGYNINEDGDEVTQLAIMAKHFQRLREDGNIIYDRCALDGYAYSMSLVKDLRVLDIIRDMFLVMVDEYDIIFYVEPELPLVEDGQRTIDKLFFESVVQSFDCIIKSYAIPVIKLKGSIDDRARDVVFEIRNYETENNNNKFYEL
jgi:nicotinamide riboside kinase